ncbi:hypothetical protein MASR2M12_16720 [Bacteroidales bacterium]
MQKVLVISHNAFSKSFNNGKTLESIFSVFPRENLAQLFFSNNEFPDYDYCENYFKITDYDVLKSVFLLSKPGRIPIQSEFKSYENNQLFCINLLKTHASKINLLRDLLWKVGKWESKSLYNWIESFKPTMVFYMGGNLGFSHKISITICQKYNLPLYVYFTDDYIIYPKYENLFEYIQKIRAKKFYKKTISFSKHCFTVNDYMSTSYSKYFNKDFITIFNGITQKPRFISIKSNELLTISYFGGLHLNRWKMIGKLGRIISSINDQIGKKIVINVYTQSTLDKEIKEEFDKSNIILNPPVFDYNYEVAKFNSSILLHVESDEQFYRSLTKLSFSTKISEYMMTGRCILGFGPAEVTSMRFLAENDLAITISSDSSPAEQIAKIKFALKNEEILNNLGLKSYLYAKNHLSYDKMKNDLKFLFELDN